MHYSYDDILKSGGKRSGEGRGLGVRVEWYGLMRMRRPVWSACVLFCATGGADTVLGAYAGGGVRSHRSGVVSVSFVMLKALSVLNGACVEASEEECSGE